MTRPASLLIALSLCVLSVTALGQEAAPELNADLLGALPARSVGPTVISGRLADIEIDPRDSNIWYVAAAFGGLWKTENRGITFRPIFDATDTFTLCCVVVDPRDSRVVWVGTGENKSQRSAHFGDGVYKSTDGGESWRRVGLAGSEHIGRIVIDPRNSNVVYVAAQGPLFAAGGERGLYKTTDGGATWTRVLHITDDTGVSDVVLDLQNPDTLYAGTYQRRRHVGQMIGGGPDGGVFKSTDGGRTWTKLTRGLPPGDVGRIALALDPHRPGRVYAHIDAKWQGRRAAADDAPDALPSPPTEDDGVGFYRSDDRGATWTRMSRYRGAGSAYYGEIYVDPRAPDTIWSIGTTFQRSRDGGRTWQDAGFERGTGAAAVHVDHHDIAFDPANPDHLIIANDGGLYESYDDGLTWRFFANLPVSQFYRVAAGNERPFYSVCGGTQDNFSVCGPSRTTHVLGIRASDWFLVTGGDGFSVRHDLGDPNLIYATTQEGGLYRFDRRTGRNTVIRPPQSRGTAGRGGTGGSGPDRVNWDAPYTTSAHDPARLYWGSNYVYRSNDRGDTWERISPDLTRNLDWRTLPIMGRVWPMDAVALHESTTALSTIVSLAESPLVEGLLYAGTDDGLLQVSENGGETWRRIDEFPGVPQWTYVGDVFPSALEADTVFVAFNNWQRGDYAPYVLKSTDRGRTWSSVTGDLPARHHVWSIVQDGVNPNLLFAGTQLALFTSVDGGRRWIRLRAGLPPAQIRDLQIQGREHDLVIGTFGRGIFIVDDYSPLREMTAAILGAPFHLFGIRDAYQFQPWGLTPDGSSGFASMAGNVTRPNPAYGALFTYHVRGAVPDDARLVLSIADESGAEVRELGLEADGGLHRAVWDLRADPAVQPRPAAGVEPAVAPAEASQDTRGAPPLPVTRSAVGPAVTPGVYRATLALRRGSQLTPVAAPQSFTVRDLPPADHVVPR